MQKFQKISDNEWLIMEILWRDSEAKSSDIYAELFESKEWADATIRTFLKRLIKKNVAASRQDEYDKRIYWYYPTVTKDEYVKFQTKGHIKQYYSGNLPDMVAGLLGDQSISDAELDEIESMLKRFRSKREV